MKKLMLLGVLSLVTLSGGCAQDSETVNDRSANTAVGRVGEGEDLNATEFKAADAFWRNVVNSAQTKVGSSITVGLGQEFNFDYASAPQDFHDGIVTFNIYDETKNENTVTVYLRDRSKKGPRGRRISVALSRKMDGRQEIVTAVVSDETRKKSEALRCRKSSNKFLPLTKLSGDFQVALSDGQLVVQRQDPRPFPGPGANPNPVEGCVFHTSYKKMDGATTLNIKAAKVKNSATESDAFFVSLPMVSAVSNKGIVTGPLIPSIQAPIGHVYPKFPEQIGWDYFPRSQLDFTLNEGASLYELMLSSSAGVYQETNMTFFLTDGIFFQPYDNLLEQTLKVRQWVGSSVSPWSNPVKFVPHFPSMPSSQKFLCEPSLYDLPDSLPANSLCTMKIALRYVGEKEIVETKSCTLASGSCLAAEYTFAKPIERFQVLSAEVSQLPSGCSNTLLTPDQVESNFAFKPEAKTKASPYIDCGSND